MISLEAEQNVIGACVVDPLAVDKIADCLAVSDFADANHREAYSAILELSGLGKAVDIFTVCERLNPEHTDLAYIANIAKNTPSAANVKAYAEVVKDRSIERQLRQAINNIAECLDTRVSTSEKLDKAQSLIMAIAEQGRRNSSGPKKAVEVLPAVLENLDNALEGKKSAIGISTGFEVVDKQTAGLHPGDLVIVAGRPSMGKSTFAMNIAEHAALIQQLPVCVFSMEMTDVQLVERTIAGLSHVDYQRFRIADLGDDEWTNVTVATAQLRNAHLFIDDTPALTIQELRARARRMKREHDIQLIVVDYLQLMSGEGDNRTQQIGNVSQGLKAIAKELRVPVIALSQLNRDVEKRSNKKPTMSDLRDSGNIEQDADVIMFIHRDEVYNEDSDYKGVAEIIVGKQRNGPTGSVYLGFVGQHCRFENFVGNLPARPNNKAQKKWNKGFDFEDVG